MSEGPLFLPSVPIWEIFVRGSVIYLSLLAAIRFFLKRGAGSVSMADMLMIVMIADATQNAMASDQKSLGDGLILAGTIIGWNFALDWLAFRFPRFERYFHPPPVVLVREGRFIRRTMRQERITEQEMMSQIRENGISEVSQVKSAQMEGDGSITVIPYEDQGSGSGGGSKNKDKGISP